jgi:acyl-CoA synthetase (AMP-forming)/AMP-acid ligase II
MAPEPAFGPPVSASLFPSAAPFSPALPMNSSASFGAEAGSRQTSSNSPRTLLEILQQVPGHRTACILPETGARISYESLVSQVSAMADAFASLGIRRGDRIASALPNGLPAIVSFLAASIAGTAAPLNPAYKHEEVSFYLEDTTAKLLVCPPNEAEEARRAAAELNIPVLSVEMSPAANVRLLDVPSGSTAGAPSSDDIALVLHTSGSTGRPKRVPLRHFNLAVSARNIANTYSLSEQDASLCVMPLFHVHGLVGSVLATLLAGGTVVVPARFDALTFWRTVRDFRVSWYSAVPSIHQVLLARIGDKCRPAGTESLRFVRSCSTSLSPEIMHKLEEVFGVPLVEAYGMTEASHQMAANPLPPRPRKPWSVGAPAGVRVSVIDAAGNHLAHDERGEVVILGPSVFKGYENNPEANSSSFASGWFRTGDEGFLDCDGYLHLTGRLKDLINRAGEKISPHQVDKVLQAHPAVAQAVTFGMPHPTLGEEVAAAVVLREPETETALIRYCRHRMAEFECPKKLFILESIPMTATGKIRRTAVAAALLSQPR